MLKCYHAVEQCEEPDTGRLRSTLFMEIPKKSEYPDYHVLIARPVCLKQIKRRIETRVYKTFEACRDDFLLMFHNARTYNQEGSIVWLDSLEMEHVFNDVYAQTQAELASSSTSTSTSETTGMPALSDSPSTDTPVSSIEDSSHAQSTADANEEMPSSESSQRRKSGMKIKLSMSGRRKRT